MQLRGVRRPSVCKHFSQIASSRRQMAGSRPNFSHDGLQVSLHQGLSRVCSRSRSRSKITWYQHIWNFTKKSLTQSFLYFSFPLSIRFSFASQSPNSCEWRHSETVCQTDSYTVRSDVLSHRALTLWSTVTLSFQTVSIIRQLDVMSKSWNELLRRWRSG